MPSKNKEKYWHATSEDWVRQMIIFKEKIPVWVSENNEPTYFDWIATNMSDIRIEWIRLMELAKTYNVLRELAMAWLKNGFQVFFLSWMSKLLPTYLSFEIFFFIIMATTLWIWNRWNRFQMTDMLDKSNISDFFYVSKIHCWWSNIIYSCLNYSNSWSDLCWN